MNLQRKPRSPRTYIDGISPVKRTLAPQKSHWDIIEPTVFQEASVKRPFIEPAFLSRVAHSAGSGSQLTIADALSNYAGVVASRRKRIPVICEDAESHVRINVFAYAHPIVGIVERFGSTLPKRYQLARAMAGERAAVAGATISGQVALCRKVVQEKNWHALIPRRFKKYTARDGVRVQMPIKSMGLALIAASGLLLGAITLLPASNNNQSGSQPGPIAAQTTANGGSAIFTFATAASVSASASSGCVSCAVSAAVAANKIVVPRDTSVSKLAAEPSPPKEAELSPISGNTGAASEPAAATPEVPSEDVPPADPPAAEPAAPEPTSEPTPEPQPEPTPEPEPGQPVAVELGIDPIEIGTSVPVPVTPGIILDL